MLNSIEQCGFCCVLFVFYCLDHGILCTFRTHIVQYTTVVVVLRCLFGRYLCILCVYSGYASEEGEKEKEEHVSCSRCQSVLDANSLKCGVPMLSSLGSQINEISGEGVKNG